MGDVKFSVINIGTLSLNKFWGEAQRVRRPSATCTLVTLGLRRLLVDPSPEPDLLRPMLFARSGLAPEDISIVFLTHAHGDHRFGLELFPGSLWLMAAEGLRLWRERSPEDAALTERFLPAEEILPSDVELLSTPGHCEGHHSLGVDTEWGRLVVAGDAVMTRDFLAAEDGFHNSVDFEQVKATIRKIRATADLIIPGHDNLILNRRDA